MASKTIILVLSIVIVSSMANPKCGRPSEFSNENQVMEYIICLKDSLQSPRYGKRSFPDQKDHATEPRVYNEYAQPNKDWTLYDILKYGERRI